MPEFDLIRRIQEILRPTPEAARPNCIIGIGDDAAVLELPPDRHLVVGTDTLVRDTHFSADTEAEAVGHKALAVNLSDLAAMGAEPAWFFVALTLPREDRKWLDGFAQGLAKLAAQSGCVLAGGDITAGPLSVTVTALGLVEPDTALTRGGASAGDLVVVSGEPGVAAGALRRLRRGESLSASELRALNYPQPRIRLGRELRGLATACIDLSDGLGADLGHILEQSAVGAEIELGRLPSPSFPDGPEEERWKLQLAGGDDYELCFTVPSGSEAQLRKLAAEIGLPLTVIGSITAQRGLVLTGPDGRPCRLNRSGYEHFAGDEGNGDDGAV